MDRKKLKSIISESFKPGMNQGEKAIETYHKKHKSRSRLAGYMFGVNIRGMELLIEDTFKKTEK